ncbi:MAG: hypothetical protein QG635_1287 [Bacteroidota bacterium]|nr:hypothetical protein [Bacteroidota bacterium]
MDIIIPIAFFATVFGICYIYFTARNRERLAMIEKSVNLTMLESSRKFDYKGLLLHLGFLALGVGLGVALASVISNSMWDMFHKKIIHDTWVQYRDDSPPLYVASIFIFGGLGLIAGYYFGRKSNKETGSGYSSIESEK